MKSTNYFALPILQDNYIWIITVNTSSIAIDCGDCKALYQYITNNNLDLKYVLVTHYHEDHIAGLDFIKKQTNATIIASESTTQHIQHTNSKIIDNILVDNNNFNLLNLNFTPLYSNAHAKGHTLYYENTKQWLFTGDILFSLGCGRLFTGNANDLLQIFNQIKQLPPQTKIFPGHEYTKANLKFVESLNYFDVSLVKNTIIQQTNTLPSLLHNELQYNPFLNSNNLDFKQALQQSHLTEIEFLAYLRKLKDNF